MENTLSVKRKLAVIVISALLFHAGIGVSQTIRDQAETHFDSVTWSESADISPFQELPSKNIPGGNEAFPLLEPASDSMVEALYPEYPGLGILDYEQMDPVMLESARAIASGFLSRTLAAEACNPEKPWVQSIAQYRLSDLPSPVVVRYSSPNYSVPDRPRVVFSLKFPDNEPQQHIHIVFISIGSRWLVDECNFEGVYGEAGSVAN